MQRRDFAFGAAVLASASGLLSRRARAQSDGEWEVLADVAESCSCEIPCPCNFGLPTTLVCRGSRLFEITGGHFGGEDIAGIAFVVTFEMGKWTRIYVDRSLTAHQREMFDRLLPTAFAGFDRAKRALESVPLEVERTNDTVRFSVPPSTVEMELLRGLGGEPIRIDGLPSPMFFGYTQYRSVVHRHESEQTSFSYAGTNAFTSRMIASGNV